MIEAPTVADQERALRFTHIGRMPCLDCPWVCTLTGSSEFLYGDRGRALMKELAAAHEDREHEGRISFSAFYDVRPL